MSSGQNSLSGGVLVLQSCSISFYILRSMLWGTTSFLIGLRLDDFLQHLSRALNLVLNKLALKNKNADLVLGGRGPSGSTD